MLPPLPRRAHQSLVRALAEARRRSPDGEVVSGHHNQNVIVRLRQPLAFLLGVPSGRELAKFRTPYASVEVVPRIWRSESEVLRVVGNRVTDVPRCLADFGDWSVHGYLPGQALSEQIPKGPIGELRIGQLAEFFARLAEVPRSELPPLPEDWPEDRDTRGFLGWLAHFTETRVDQPNRRRFGSLFEAVGIPQDAMGRFMKRVPDMEQRPFTLLHTDLHRANVVIMPGVEGQRLAVIDWELALYGDPLHDLATHLVRMDYVDDEREQMIRAWTAAMKRTGHGDMTAGMDKDLGVYIDFEYAQSVFPDVMRAALSLPEHPDESALLRAAGQVRRAMERAREPLSLPRLPGEGEVALALLAWRAADTGRGMDRPDEGKGAGETAGPLDVDHDHPGSLYAGQAQ
ncbi:aminoglycoside phosphotransferase family protein [Streptomyces longisporus]|uniref:Phosphotransferase n=1 Tax=Streptomyces longisporus TaxID=1948 RepID=A0ABP5YH36_STRLO